MSARPDARFAFGHPAHFVALGFGAGLAPFAPGTIGTLLAFPLWWVMDRGYEPEIFLGLIAFFFAAGVWACELAGRHLGVADHGAFVWDEVVAFLLVLAIAPEGFGWQLAAFLLFRFFDIAKPWPASWAQDHLPGGWGVMMDDIVAGLYAAAALYAGIWAAQLPYVARLLRAIG